MINEVQKKKKKLCVFKYLEGSRYDAITDNFLFFRLNNATMRNMRVLRYIKWKLRSRLKIVITKSVLHFVLFRVKHRGEEEWKSWPCIAIQFTFFNAVSLLFSNGSQHLTLVRPRPFHSRLLSPILWMRVDRCIHEKLLFPHLFVGSHDIHRV